VTRTQRQIELHRKGVACVEVRDCNGRPCVGVPVWVEQESHAFVFGCVLPELDALAEPVRQRFASRFDEVFSQRIDATRPPQTRGARLDVSIGIPLTDLNRVLDRLASDGSPLGIWIGGETNKPDDERAAAERIAALYSVCFAHANVRAIVWNGEMLPAGGLLRSDGSPRPAFRYLHKLLGTIWHTRASGETNTDGRFEFRGFFGDYRVAARLGEAPATVSMLAHRNDPAAMPFILSIPIESIHVE
jgi:hypothetical protein